MTEFEELGVANIAQRTRHTSVHRTKEDVGFAPPRPPFVCRSRAGRWRNKHDPDGQGCCIFCDKVVG